MTPPDTGSGRGLAHSRFLPPVTIICLCRDCCSQSRRTYRYPQGGEGRAGGVHSPEKIGLVQKRWILYPYNAGRRAVSISDQVGGREVSPYLCAYTEYLKFTRH